MGRYVISSHLPTVRASKPCGCPKATGERQGMAARREIPPRGIELATGTGQPSASRARWGVPWIASSASPHSSACSAICGLNPYFETDGNGTLAGKETASGKETIYERV